MGPGNKQQAAGLKKEIGPRWFMLSYDAGEEIRDEDATEENKAKTCRKYVTNDFRKKIIKTLREEKVVEMEQPAETTILFLDPRVDKPVNLKLSDWEKKFDAYDGDDFYYLIVPVVQFENGSSHNAQNPNNELAKNFQKMKNDIIDEEPPNPFSRFL